MNKENKRTIWCTSELCQEDIDEWNKEMRKNE